MYISNIGIAQIALFLLTYRYLLPSEKDTKIDHLKDKADVAMTQVEKLKQQINKLTEVRGISLDEMLNKDLLQIMLEKKGHIHTKFPEGSFQRLFWDQQLQAASVSDMRQVRWHPTIIKWCLNLKLLSSSAYHAMKTSGFVKLPSERTLRDYTNYIKEKPGSFHPEVLKMLQEEAKIESIPESKRFVVIVLDEMKIKESIAYNKHTGEMIGFVNLGDINNAICDLLRELNNTCDHPPVASHLLTLMVRGVFFNLDFPLAHFGTDNITASELFPIVWEGVRHLENSGFKVIGITADGASPNRKFFRMHKEADESCTYKTKNPYADNEDRDIYFFSDPPHLIKTARNCLSHSYGHGYTRKLWVMYL